MNFALKNDFSYISAILRKYWRGFLFISALLTPIGCSANVFINEIAWMGNSSSPNDEWIELYNDSNDDIDLSGWKLVSKDGKMNIDLSGKITKISFYLLERTDDNTVSSIPADKIYTGSLANTGEALEIYDNFGKIVDSVDCSSGWFTGDNTTKKTMERIGPEDSSANWATSANSGGTPKSKNSVSDSQTRIDSSGEKTNYSTVEDRSTKIYPGGIIINEVLPSPEGSDEQNEWVEIYNQNKEKIDLSGWKLKDDQGKLKTFVFPKNTFIDALGFLIFSRNTTKIILNNDNDGISLINPKGESVDKVSYLKAPTNQSYSRINSDWVWTTKLTPGSKNILSSPSSENNDVIKNTAAKNNLAPVGLQIPKNFSKKAVSILLIAALLAVVSGIIILFIKKKLTK